MTTLTPHDLGYTDEQVAELMTTAQAATPDEPTDPDGPDGPDEREDGLTGPDSAAAHGLRDSDIPEFAGGDLVDEAMEAWGAGPHSTEDTGNGEAGSRH